MPTRVQLPDGSIGEFPDGMDNAAIEAVLKKQFPAASAKPPAPTYGGEMYAGAKRGLSGIVGGLKQTVTHPINTLTGVIAQGVEAGEAGKRAADQGENWAGQTLAIAENFPVLGPLVRKAEEAGPGYAKLAPQTAGAATEALTYYAAPKVGEAALAKGAGLVAPLARKITGTTPAVTEDLVKRTSATKEYGNAASRLQSQIETARENALKEGNAKYARINEKLKNLPGDTDALRHAQVDAMYKIKGTEVEPTILKSIGSRLEEQNGISYQDLQGYYTELGRELSKGTLPSDLYTAYDAMQEAIGEQMQKIADSQGMGRELTDARNYWRRMKQTFNKPHNPTDAASTAMETAAPEWVSQMEQVNKLRNLGFFDQDIPGAAENVAKTRQAAKGPQSPDFQKTKIGTEDVRSAKQESLQRRREAIVRKTDWVAQRVGVLGAIYAVGRGKSFGDVVAIGGAAFGTGEAIDALLKSPKVVKFLTNPTAADIASIPPELRGNLSAIASTATRRGIRVNPALISAIGANNQSSQQLPAPRSGNPSDDLSNPANAH